MPQFGKEFALAGQEFGEDTAGRAQEFGDVTTGKRIVDGRAVARRDDDSGTAQDRELLGQVGRLDVDLGEEFAYGHRTALQELQNADPDRVSEHAEELGFRLVQGYLHAHERSRRCLDPCLRPQGL